MLIQVKDKFTGKIYNNDMSQDEHCILEIHFCTSYTQVIVQDKIIDGNDCFYPEHNVIIPPLNSKPNWIDEIAIVGEHEGEWVLSNEILTIKER